MKKDSYLFVFPTGVLGGAERVMFNIISNLLRDNKQVTVLIMSRGRQDGWEYIENHKNLKMIIQDYSSEKKAIFPLLIKLISLSINNDFKLIFSSHTHINAVLSMLKKMGFFQESYLVSRESTVVFERFHGAIKKLFEFFYHFMYGKQDLLICQTQKMYDSLIENLGFVPAKKMTIIPNPVNIEYINDNISKSHFEIYKDNLIVACGRWIKLKQFDLLIDAFYQCQKDFPDYKLVIIGDGPERDNLQEKVRSLDLNDKVIFPGKISNPFQWFARAKIGVISSEIEGFPNVLLEMMASKVNFIISTPCTDGIKELPNISITQDITSKSIEIALRDALKNEYDYSELYYSYIISQRSVESFIEKMGHLVENT